MAKRIVIEKSYVAQFIIYLPSLKRVLWSLVHLKFQSTKVKVAFGWINWQVHDPSLQPISLASLWAQFSEDKNSSPFCSVFLVMIICPGKIKSASVYGIRRMCKTNVIFWFFMSISSKCVEFDHLPHLTSNALKKRNLKFQTYRYSCYTSKKQDEICTKSHFELWGFASSKSLTIT